MLLFENEILCLSITGRIFGHFTGRVHGLGCALENFLDLDFIIEFETEIYFKFYLFFFYF